MAVVRVFSPSTMWLTLALVSPVFVALSAVGPARADDGAAENAAVQAVQVHIEAARSGNVAALRDGSCGMLAAAMTDHSDAEVRREFIDAYDVGPDLLTASPEGADAMTVTGSYLSVTDLEIAFTVKNEGGWKICEIRRGNGIFGPLPGPFE